jgi:hypothetical protein
MDVDYRKEHFGRDVLVPDIAGWRRTRLPNVPADAYVALAPDWICVVLSTSTEAINRGKKLRIYAREGVAHAWLIDPIARSLEGRGVRDAWSDARSDVELCRLIVEGDIMRSRILILSALLAAASATTCAAAEDSSVKQDAKDVGHAVGDLAKDVGHSAKKTAKAVGHGTRDVTRTVGHAFRDGARETKRATRRAAKQVKNAAK